MIVESVDSARLERLPFEVHPAANLFPMMSGPAFAELVEDIRQHGVKEMIVIWRGMLLDGRNRATALMEIGLDPANHACDIEDKEGFDPVAYVMSANLHRRHLTTGQRAIVAAEVATLGHGQKKGDTSNDVSQNDAATLLSVSVPSVQRAKAVLDSGDDALITSVKTGELPVSKAAEIVKDRKPHVTNNGGGDEWYTPAKYIQAARRVLGDIDLDPASSQEANGVVMASRIYTAADDGLSQEWRGRLWVNPPFSKELCAAFIEKLVDDFTTDSVTEALLLVNNATETAWFQMAVRASKAVCFLETRIHFLKPGGQQAGQPLQGQAVLYFGDDVGKFAKAFARFGQVLGRIGGAS